MKSKLNIRRKIMKKKLTIPSIQIIMNLMIVLLILNGALIVGYKLHKLILKPDEIKLIRLEIPWIHPVNDVTIMLQKDILENNPDIHKKISKNVLIRDIILRASVLILFILILIQINRLIIAINMRTFFVPKNFLIIRNLSVLVVIWVICKFIIYQLIPIFIPTEIMWERINFCSIKENLLFSLLTSIDFKMLFASIILYVISISFKDGYKLKEQTDLTI